MCVPCPRLQTVELMQDKETHTLKCNGEILKINSSHFCKLVNIYISVSTLYEHVCMIRTNVIVIQSFTPYVSIHMPYAMFQEQLYKLNCRDDPRFDHFLGRVWCLLRRYHVSFIRVYRLFYKNDLKY